MKIVQMNVIYSELSTGRNVMEMQEYFREVGHESYTISCRMESVQEGVYDIGGVLYCNLHMALSHITGLQGYFSIVGTKRMIRWMDEIRPDVVHINNIRSGMVNMPMLFGYLKDNDIPVVLTLHDCYMYTGRCFYYTLNGCYQWEIGCRNCPTSNKSKCEKSIFIDPCKKMYEDKKKWFSGLKYLAVIGVSEWVKKEAERSFLKGAPIISRIYNWVDLDIFRYFDKYEHEELKIRYGFNNCFIVMGIAAKVSEEKGLYELIEIAKAYPEIKVVLVGNIDNSMSLPYNMERMGFISDTYRIAEYFGMADVFVHPSPEETFGKTLAESLACGTPAIGYNMTATSELLCENCGILVDYDGKRNEHMISAVASLKKRGREFYSKNCRRFAERNFSMKKNINSYLRVYESLISLKKDKSKA